MDEEVNYAETADSFLELLTKISGNSTQSNVKIISAIAAADSNSGLVDIYIPPDEDNIFKGIKNYSIHQKVKVGEVVKIIEPHGRLTDCWIIAVNKSSSELTSESINYVSSDEVQTMINTSKKELIEYLSTATTEAKEAINNLVEENKSIVFKNIELTSQDYFDQGLPGSEGGYGYHTCLPLGGLSDDMIPEVNFYKKDALSANFSNYCEISKDNECPLRFFRNVVSSTTEGSENEQLGIQALFQYAKDGPNEDYSLIFDRNPDRFLQAGAADGVHNLILCHEYQLSVAVWVKQEQSKSSYIQTLVGVYSYPNPLIRGGYCVYLYKGSPIFTVDGSFAYYSGTSIADGNWHLIVCTYFASNATGSIYIDGKLANQQEKYSGTWPITYPTTYCPYVTVGRGCVNRYEDWYPFDGQLYDLKVYQNVLTEAQALSLYETKLLGNNISGLTAWYRFRQYDSDQNVHSGACPAYSSTTTNQTNIYYDVNQYSIIINPGQEYDLSFTAWCDSDAVGMAVRFACVRSNDNYKYCTIVNADTGHYQSVFYPTAEQKEYNIKLKVPQFGYTNYCKLYFFIYNGVREPGNQPYAGKMFYMKDIAMNKSFTDTSFLKLYAKEKVITTIPQVACHYSETITKNYSLTNVIKNFLTNKFILFFGGVDYSSGHLHYNGASIVGDEIVTNGESLHEGVYYDNNYAGATGKGIQYFFYMESDDMVVQGGTGNAGSTLPSLSSEGTGRLYFFNSKHQGNTLGYLAYDLSAYDLNTQTSTTPMVSYLCQALESVTPDKMHILLICY